MTEADYRECLTATNVPEHTHDGYVRYFCNHLMPGSFLRAVLTNDLRGACLAGDEVNRAALAQHVLFLWNFAPADAWGSPERVKAWVNQTDRTEPS